MYDVDRTSRPPKGTSLRGNTSYDVQLVKIGPPVQARRDPKNKVNKPVGFYGPICPQFRMPPVRGSVVRIRGTMLTQHFWIRTSLSSTAAAAPARRPPVL